MPLLYKLKFGSKNKPKLLMLYKPEGGGKVKKPLGHHRRSVSFREDCISSCFHGKGGRDYDSKAIQKIFRKELCITKALDCFCVISVTMFDVLEPLCETFPLRCSQWFFSPCSTRALCCVWQQSSPTFFHSPGSVGGKHSWDWATETIPANQNPLLTLSRSAKISLCISQDSTVILLAIPALCSVAITTWVSSDVSAESLTPP